jgi:hypothetical protein
MNTTTNTAKTAKAEVQAMIRESAQTGDRIETKWTEDLERVLFHVAKDSYDADYDNGDDETAPVSMQVYSGWSVLDLGKRWEIGLRMEA